MCSFFFPVMYACRSGVADILTMIGLYRVMTLVRRDRFYGDAICVVWMRVGVERVP